MGSVEQFMASALRSEMASVGKWTLKCSQLQKPCCSPLPRVHVQDALTSGSSASLHPLRSAFDTCDPRREIAGHEMSLIVESVQTFQGNRSRSWTETLFGTLSRITVTHVTCSDSYLVKVKYAFTPNIKDVKSKTVHTK